ncbi:MAG TPA: metallophosphoesterase family protein, partial [Trueperaceae bacterium]
MKLAVIADTHGNLSALEAVLRDMEEQGADAVVCLGDVASFGPQPRETLERVRRLGCPVVQGNADAELVRPDMADVLRQTADTSSEAREIISWCARQLDKDDLAYLAALPLTAARKVGGVTVLAVHGSPRSFDDRIVASTSDEQLGAMLEGVHASIVVGGHTHTQLLR